MLAGAQVLEGWGGALVDGEDVRGTARVSFEACYRAHKADVYRWCLRFAGGRAALAEDLAHDVFLRLLERREQLERPDEVGGWLYTVTVHLALDRLRREESWSGRLMRLFKAELRAEVPAAEALLADRQEAQRALALMQRLPARERVVLSMALVDDKSQREIAQALALSEGYVSKLLERGKARVRRLGWEVSDERA